MLVAFALGVPIYQAPDEPLHVDRVLDAAGRAGFQEYDQNTTGMAVARSLQIMRFDPRPAPFGRANAPERPVPSFDNLGGELSGTAVNQLNQHPPTYYAAVAAVRTAVVSMLPDTKWRFDRDVLLLRLLNVLMVLPLPTLCALAAHHLGWSSGRQVVAALVPVCIPQLAHIGSVVNNDNLLIVSAAVSLAVGARLLKDGLDWRSGAVFAVATAVGIMTKSNGLALLAVVAAVCWTGLRRRRGDWPIVAMVLAVVTFSGWFYVRAFVRFGDPFIRPSLLPDNDDAVFEPLSFLAEFTSRLTMSFWGRFGVLWIDLPAVWVAVLTLALVVAVAVAAIRPGRPGLRMMMAPLAIVLPSVAANALRAHLRTGLFPGIQGRYLFVALVPLALAVVRASEFVAERVARRALVAVAAVNFGLAVVQVGRTFWEGPGIAARLGSVAAWSPLGQAGALLLVAAIVAVPACLAISERVASLDRTRVLPKGTV